MAEASKSPAKSAEQAPERVPATATRQPLASLRREIDRLITDFDRGLWGSSWLSEAEPFWQRLTHWGTLPAVDISDKAKHYEITAELPGMDEADVEVKLTDETLTIKGEKKEEKEEKEKGYVLSERRYGSFERSFRVPKGIDPDKIEATVKKGVLTVILPKTPEAQKQEKKIAVKAG